MSGICEPSLHKLLIVGAGGSGREIAWLARDIYGADLQILFAVEPEWLSEKAIDGIPVIALNDVPRIDVQHYIVAIGNIAERRRLAAVCDTFGLYAATLVHPSVVHSPRIEFGFGSIVCAGTIVTTNVHIGRHAHVNIGCTLSHDVIVGSFATLSPGVHLSGHVQLEDEVFLGTGVNVINGKPTQPLVLGRGAVVAAGACVTRSVPRGALVAGVPAVRKR